MLAGAALLTRGSGTKCGTPDGAFDGKKGRLTAAAYSDGGKERKAWSTRRLVVGGGSGQITVARLTFTLFPWCKFPNPPNPPTPATHYVLATSGSHTGRATLNEPAAPVNPHLACHARRGWCPNIPHPSHTHIAHSLIILHYLSYITCARATCLPAPHLVLQLVHAHPPVARASRGRPRLTRPTYPPSRTHTPPPCAPAHQCSSTCFRGWLPQASPRPPPKPPIPNPHPAHPAP
eukprot:363243-Chlamydomonas_euryale.AAC.6